jgi:hypothetical protein
MNLLSISSFIIYKTLILAIVWSNLPPKAGDATISN